MYCNLDGLVNLDEVCGETKASISDLSRCTPTSDGFDVPVFVIGG